MWTDLPVVCHAGIIEYVDLPGKTFLTLKVLYTGVHTYHYRVHGYQYPVPRVPVNRGFLQTSVEIDWIFLLVPKRGHACH